jgi:hypothetical protein
VEGVVRVLIRRIVDEDIQRAAGYLRYLCSCRLLNRE